jgi:hypothetical protein
MLFSKILTKIFDTGADLQMMSQKSKGPAIPDVSHLPFKHLVSSEEKADPARLYAPTSDVPDIPLEPHFEMKIPGVFDVEVLRGSFQSAVETPYPVNNTVHVDFYRRRGTDGAGPTVVMIPGWRMESYFYFDWWCWRYAAWGLNSIIIDIPFHFGRVPEGSFGGQLLLTPDTTWNLMVMKQCFNDTHRLVNWLRALGAGPIGTFGVSFGALLSGLYVCNATNADFTVMGMRPVDCIQVLEKTHLADALHRLEDAGTQTMLTDPLMPRLLNLDAMMPKIPNKNIFIAMGTLDRLVEPESIERAAEIWGGLPWLRKYSTGHINTFALNPGFIMDKHRFLRKEVLS